MLEPQHLVIAERFDEFGVGVELQRDRVGPGFHERFRIIDRHDQFHVADTGPPESLDDV